MYITYKNFVKYYHLEALFIKAITTKLSISYLLYTKYLVDMNFCVKIPNRFPSQRIEGWALIQGVGADSREELFGYSFV